MNPIIIALDQGTTSSRAIAFDSEGNIIGLQQQEFKQIFPKSGWVEHDPMEILNSQKNVLKALINSRNVNPDQIASIGITNQRETIVAWNKRTGKPVHNAIVWQDKRTREFCDSITKNDKAYILEETGLVVDSYFSATKMHWILKNSEEAQICLTNNELLFGTIDTWLIWNLSKEKNHLTDYSNASRTMLFNINHLDWDEKLLELFEVPKETLPKVINSSDDFGHIEINNYSIPIQGVAGDQQAALFGQQCWTTGEAKNTYGTGCFLLMNTGDKKVKSKNGLLTTIAWGLNGKITYALEGSVFIAGAAIQWLRDGLKLIDHAPETESEASAASEVESLIIVPAFSGLGTPYWDMSARGAIFGLTRDTGIPEICKATLESLAFQSKDVLDAMTADSKTKLTSLKVDGGAANNNYLMQFQSDILQISIQRPQVTESTALGAAYLAGLKSGVWTIEKISKIAEKNIIFSPHKMTSSLSKKIHYWDKAIKRTVNWIED